MLRLRSSLIQRGLRSRRPAREVRKRFVSSNKEGAGKKPLGDAARKNPDVVDQAASTQASRKSGGAGIGTLFGTLVLGTSGYVGVRLCKDAEFCSTMREKAPSLVEAVGNYIPLADDKKQAPPAPPAMEAPPAPERGAQETPAPEVPEPAVEEPVVAVADQPTETAAATDDAVAEEASGPANDDKADVDAPAPAEPDETAPVEDEGSGDEKAAKEAIAAEVTAAAEAEVEVELAINDAISKAEKILKERPGEAELSRLRNEVKAVKARVGNYQAEVREAAVADVQSSQEKLRQDLEDVLAQDLTTDDMDRLKRRVVKLVMELQEQNKREAGKLIAVLNAAEGRAQEKTEDALREQEEKYEELMQARLADQEVVLRARFAEKMDEAIADNSQRLQYISESQAEKYEQETVNKVAAVREAVTAQLTSELEEKLRVESEGNLRVQNERARAVEEINLRLQALDKVFQWNSEYLQKSHQIHLVCTALLAFHESLEGSTNQVSEAAASLKVAAGGDRVIDAAIKSIPRHAYTGVATMPELQRRFERVKKECRKTFFTPDNGGILGRAVGSVAAELTIAPDGLVQGESAEARLARATYFLERGNLQSAIGEIESIDEEVAAVAGDWLRAARTRVMVTQAVRLMSSHITTLAATLS